MYLVDYHMHSKYSFDGHEDIMAMCEQAITKGLKEIAITDHYDLFEDEKYSRDLDYEKINEDIEVARKVYEGKLLIRKGVELGQPHKALKQSQDFLDKYDLDFVIGSVHNLEDALDIGEYDFRLKDIELLYFDYLHSLMEMTKKCDFDVMGHITYPMRYLYEQLRIYPNMNVFKESIEKLYKLLIEKGRGIEVNASGFFQTLGRPMPDFDLVKLYKQCGGEIITVGCDAHHLSHIGCAVEMGLEVIKSAGFNYVTTYEHRCPQFKRI